MRHLFWQLNFLLLSGVTNSQLMYHEAASLARQIDPAWGYASLELMTLYQKAKGLEAGERVEFNGRKYPSLYTPKNDTLIGLFEISTEEQRQMSVKKKHSKSYVDKDDEVMELDEAWFREATFVEAKPPKKSISFWPRLSISYARGARGICKSARP